LNRKQKQFKYIYRAVLTFRKTSGQQGSAAKEWESILVALEKVGSASKFRPCVWKVEKHAITTDAGTDVTMVSDGKHPLCDVCEYCITLQEVRENCLEKIVELLTKKDAIASSEYFRGIFERDAQIRIVLSSIKSFLENRRRTA